MRWIIALLLCVFWSQPTQSQPTSNVITAMGVCLTTLDLGIRANVVSNLLDPQNKKQGIILKNTFALYKHTILTSLPPETQLQIVQAYLVIKQEFVESLVSLEDQELEEFVTNLNKILDQCVSAASYQSGTTE